MANSFLQPDWLLLAGHTTRMGKHTVWNPWRSSVVPTARHPKSRGFLRSCRLPQLEAAPQGLALGWQALLDITRCSGWAQRCSPWGSSALPWVRGQPACSEPDPCMGLGLLTHRNSGLLLSANLSARVPVLFLPR